ncbi:cupin domain-containing protein [Streptomyces chartreusis]|uniref:cupin domain-containing protein n=1 Tax=Streptomyces chartreusis TaxID=1969 RepID=UPI0036945339
MQRGLAARTPEPVEHSAPLRDMTPSADPLSDVLASLHIRAGSLSGLEARGSWALRFQVHEHIKIGAVLDGCCWLGVDNAEPVRFGRATVSSAIQPLLRVFLDEVSAVRAGTSVMSDRLTEILFIQALRAVVAADTPDQASLPGWLGALNDPCISRALLLMHQQAVRPWTVSTLGAHVGMGRASFAPGVLRAVVELSEHAVEEIPLSGSVPVTVIGAAPAVVGLGAG